MWKLSDSRYAAPPPSWVSDVAYVSSPVSPPLTGVQLGPPAAGSDAIPLVVAAIMRRLPEPSSASPITDVLGSPTLAGLQWSPRAPGSRRRRSTSSPRRRG